MSDSHRIWAGHYLLLGIYRGKGIASDASFLLSADNGNLVRIDLPSGRARTIVAKPTPVEYVFGAIVSPDARQVAYSWFTGDYFDLRLASADGGSSDPRMLVRADSMLVGIEPYDWSPDGRSIAVYLGRRDGTFQLGLVSVTDGSVRVLKELGRHIPGNVSFSPDGRHLAYDFRDSARSYDLGVIGIDGGDDHTLLGGPGMQAAPMWAPDGKRVAFVSDRNGRSALWSVAMEGIRAVGEPVLFLSDSTQPIGFFELAGTPIGFARDDRFYFFKWKPNKTDVYVAALSGGVGRTTPSARMLSERSPGQNSFGAWSPDAKRIAFASVRPDNRRVIVVHDVASGLERDLDSSAYTPVSWFPDGRSLLAYGTKPGGGDATYRVDAESGKGTLLFDVKEGWQAFPSLSADGQRITYVERDYPRKENQIWTYALDTRETKLVQRFPLPPMVTSFAPSPDGRYAALVGIFQEERGRPSALRIMSLSDGSSRDLFKEPWGDDTKFSGVAWSLDGRRVYFVRKTMDFANEELWRADVESGARERVGIQKKIVRFPRFDGTGRTIVFHGSDSDKEVELWSKQ